MKYTIFPSINFDYMVSEQGFEFALEKANFLENFWKNREEEKSRGGVSLKHQLSRAHGMTPPT